MWRRPATVSSTSTPARGQVRQQKISGTSSATNPTKWYVAADSLATAADALNTYAHVLEWAQQQAADAIRLWDAAQAETQNAQQSYQKAAAQAPPEHPVGPFVDTGASGRQNAIDTLSAARKQVGAAGDVAARFLDQEADSAPKRSNWLDKAGGFLETAGAHVVNGFASFGNAMVHHPGETASLVGGLLLTEVSTLGEGAGFVLDATGVGAIGGVPLNAVSAIGITAGAGITATASGLLMQHAAPDDAITPVRTGRSEPVGPTKTDNMKEHLTDRDLDAARRELNGEVVKPSRPACRRTMWMRCGMPKMVWSIASASSSACSAIRGSRLPTRRSSRPNFPRPADCSTIPNNSSHDPKINLPTTS
jgi:hypothetical protein